MEKLEGRKTSKLVSSHEMHCYARKAREKARLTQKEAADRLSVTQPNISRAESDPSGRYVKLQARMIRELAGWRCEGPLWHIYIPENAE